MKQCAGSAGFSTYIPCFISVCAEDTYYGLSERHMPLIDVTFGMQNLLLAAHSYGIEGTVLTWMFATRHQERELRRILDIPKEHRIVYNMALGYPKAWPPAPGRKSVESTCIFHRCEGR
jgi:nitroreductase